MTAAGHGRPFEIIRIPDNLLRAPLDYILADHFRQLKVCESLEDLVAHPTRHETGTRAGAIRVFLESDLPLHVADEEEDLFPSLRSRCDEEEGIDEVLDRLANSHAAGVQSAKPVMEGLAKITAGTQVRAPRNFGRAALTWTANQRRHLTLENEVVLPLARRRLTAHDLERIGRAMAARRSIIYPD